MAFVRRLISASVTLAQSSGTSQPTTFAESGGSSVTIQGSRTSVRISNSGSPADGRAQVKVWGMTPSLMNQLSTLGLVFNLVPRNTLTISAGDEDSGMSAVFSGTVYAAYGDYSGQPDVPFIFECLAGVADAVAPATPTSFAGSTDVANLMSGIARQMNLGFENNGVSATLTSPYLAGSLMVQARRVADAAGIEWGIMGGATLAIWPRGGNRNTPSIPVISPDTGMIGYPAFTQQGIIVRTLFDPQISFGSLVEVRSSVLSSIAQAQQGQQAASSFPSQWAVNKLDLALDSLLPKGQWMSTVHAYNPGYAKAIVPPAN